MSASQPPETVCGNALNAFARPDFRNPLENIMSVADLNKAEIVKANARSANDTGSPEVQVALLVLECLRTNVPALSLMVAQGTGADDRLTEAVLASVRA